MRLKGVAAILGIPEAERDVDDAIVPLLARVCKRLSSGRYIVVVVDDPFAVAAIEHGEIIDFVCSTEAGAFSLRTCGELPTADFAKMAFPDPDGWERRILTEGGLYSYLSTDDISEALKKDPFIVEAMAYQMSKEVWAMATVFCGNFNEIVLLGGLLKDDSFFKMLTKRLTPLGKNILHLEVV
ncbi:MAG: hypothetical protein H5T91_01515 [Synergistetes bacterium]|nr:MAG: putative butyrate kinase [bacterium 42_11]MBC7331097.1 hypothetical protein [Synergistota bacterium]MDK2871006.1 butyrate kinase [bacterium]